MNSSIASREKASSSSAKEIAFPSAPARAVRPIAVDVVLGVLRQVVVDDVGDPVDVEAARGDVGGDQDRERARP